MNLLLIIALGGAVGAVCRYGLSIGLYRLLGAGFPYGTLAVNILGSFIIGFLLIVMVDRLAVSTLWRALLVTGFCGAFTTFSTFSWETLQLFEKGSVGLGMLNILLNVSVCLIAVWLGIMLGRQL